MNPKAALEARTWTDAALCTNEPYSSWTWVPETFNGGEPASTVAALFEVCSACPVRLICLDDAYNERTYTVMGIWGGTTVTERSAMDMAELADTMAERHRTWHTRARLPWCMDCGQGYLWWQQVRCTYHPAKLRGLPRHRVQIDPDQSALWVDQVDTVAA